MTDIDSFRPIGITVGEPAGIGPDILLMLVSHQSYHCPLVAITDPALLASRAEMLGFNIKFKLINEGQLLRLTPLGVGELYVLPIPMASVSVIAGAPQKVHAQWVLDTIRKATLLCASKQIGAMVTGPVQKSIINEAGIGFSGHTEFIADCLNHVYSGAKTPKLEPLMMLTSGTKIPQPLRVALVTTHHPLEKIPELITEELVYEKITTLSHYLQKFYGIESPKILICGLNPHAGEQGHLGREEILFISPAVARAQKKGLNPIGPLPADTLFTPRHLQNADAVLAMYHDQGLPVLKYASFGGGINVTLGIKIVRTSVDHGTALDLAGSHKADPSSLKAAIDEALYILTRVKS